MAVKALFLSCTLKKSPCVLNLNSLIGEAAAESADTCLVRHGLSR